MKFSFILSCILLATSALAGDFSIHIHVNGKDCSYPSRAGTADLNAFGSGLEAAGVEFWVDARRSSTNDSTCPLITDFKILISESLFDPYENHLIARHFVSRAKTAKSVFLSANFPSLELVQNTRCYDNALKEIECADKFYSGTLNFKNLNEYRALVGYLQD